MMAKPIVPWMGGKHRLAKHILPMIPDHTCYVEPFCGGASILFLKPESKVEVINDVNGELINLYRIVQHHLDEFVRHFKWSLSSRQIFTWEKMKNPETLTDIQRAARFFYLQKSCFGARITNPSFGTATSCKPKFNLLRIEEDLSAAHLRLARTVIESLEWDKVMRKYDRDHTFFYLDPPYWQLEGYGVDFDFNQYETMASMMLDMKGKVLLSINDHPDVRDVFSSFYISELATVYTVGGRQKAANELLIKNF